MLLAVLNTLTVKNIGRRDVIGAKTIRNLGCDVVWSFRNLRELRGSQPHPF